MLTHSNNFLVVRNDKQWRHLANTSLQHVFQHKLNIDILHMIKLASNLHLFVDRVDVLKELFCVRYGYGHCSQALLGSDKTDFIVQFLRLQ